MDAFARLSVENPTLSDMHCPQNRIDFHNTFSLLIRMGNPDRNQEKCRRQVIVTSIYGTLHFYKWIFLIPQLSKEETLWQSELKDMIWLELQAFLADRSMHDQDVFLCEERKTVAGLLDEIANYKFNPLGDKQRDSVDSGVELGAVECQCLSMFCMNCSKNQNLAIDQVTFSFLTHPAAVKN